MTISFCTVCMDRLQHLKITLPSNIMGNIDHPGVVFIILDYSSKDGLAEWIKENFEDYLISGLLVYYRYEGATFFHRTHSRNMLFKIASTDIVCNVDADNYIGDGFAQFISEKFTLDPDIFLTPIDFFTPRKNHDISGDVLGRLCVKKEHFLAVGGFDERMKNYGFEDYDITNRLELFGLKRCLIREQNYLRYIPHENGIRYSTSSFENFNSKVFISYELPWRSSLIYLFENSVCSFVTVLNNARMNAGNPYYAYNERVYLFENSFENNAWSYGKWNKKDGVIILNFDNRKMTLNIESEFCLRLSTDEEYLQVTDLDMINSLARLQLMSENRLIMEANLESKSIKINTGTFGSGFVTKNFKDLILLQ